MFNLQYLQLILSFCYFKGFNSEDYDNFNSEEPESEAEDSDENDEDDEDGEENDDDDEEAEEESEDDEE
jgi:hypothetical protein